MSRNKDLAEQLLTYRLKQLIDAATAGEKIDQKTWDWVLKTYSAYDAEQKFDNMVTFDGVSDEDLIEAFTKDQPLFLDNVTQKPSRERHVGKEGRRSQGVLADGDWQGE
ncbi:hypothetical protein [Azospirillum sp. sgz301742]